MKTSSSLFRNAFLYTFTNLLVKSTSFLLLPIFSHYIEPAEFGAFSILIAGYIIIVSCYLGAFQSAFSKIYLDETDELRKPKIISQFFSLTLIVSVPAALLCLAFANSISLSLFSNTNYVRIIQILSLSMVFDNFQTAALHIFKTQENAKKAVTYTAASALLNFGMTIVLLAGFNQGITAIANAQFLSVLIVTIAMLRKIKVSFTLKFEKAIIVPFMKFAYPLMVAGIFTALIDLVDRFLIKYYIDEKAVGIYSFSYRIANIMNMFVISFRTAWTPHAIKLYRRDDYSTHFGTSFSKLIFISLFIFLGVSLLIPHIFTIGLTSTTFLFNQSYHSGLVIIPLILLAYLFNGILSFFTVYPYISGKSYHILISDGIGLSVNIAANIFLIPRLGLVGAALATLLSYLCSMIYMWSISIYHVNVKVNVNSFLLLTGISTLIFMVGQTYNSIFVSVTLLLLFLFWGVKLMGVNLLKQAG